MQMIQIFWETVWQSLTNLSIIVSIVSIGTPQYLPKGVEIYVHTEPSMWKFISALFIIAILQWVNG